MPHEGYADPIMNDGPRFHLYMPVIELTEHDTRAIEASVVSSTPSVAKTIDGVTHEIWPTPTEPNGARGSSCPTPTRILIDQGSKAGPRRARGRLASNRARGENIDEP